MNCCNNCNGKMIFKNPLCTAQHLNVMDISKSTHRYHNENHPAYEYLMQRPSPKYQWLTNLDRYHGPRQGYGPSSVHSKPFMPVDVATNVNTSELGFTSWNFFVPAEPVGLCLSNDAIKRWHPEQFCQHKYRLRFNLLSGPGMPSLMSVAQQSNHHQEHYAHGIGFKENLACSWTQPSTLEIESSMAASSGNTTWTAIKTDGSLDTNNQYNS